MSLHLFYMELMKASDRQIILNLQIEVRPRLENSNVVKVPDHSKLCRRYMAGTER